MKPPEFKLPPSAGKLALRRPRSQRRGFTLVELVMVLVVMGVLAAVAMPRILNISGFDARGFHDQSLAYLRYAQKTAVAQRRTVCVAFTTTSITLTMASAAGASNCSTAATLVGPQGESPVVLNAKTGVAYTATPTAFNFDSLGQPITTGGASQPTQTLQVGGISDSITIETNTGYVHE
jgi:MSHA pilin protein MshC